MFFFVAGIDPNSGMIYATVANGICTVLTVTARNPAGQTATAQVYIDCRYSSVSFGNSCQITMAIKIWSFERWLHRHDWWFQLLFRRLHHQQSHCYDHLRAWRVWLWRHRLAFQNDIDRSFIKPRRDTRDLLSSRLCSLAVPNLDMSHTFRPRQTST